MAKNTNTEEEFEEFEEDDEEIEELPPHQKYPPMPEKKPMATGKFMNNHKGRTEDEDTAEIKQQVNPFRRPQPKPAQEIVDELEEEEQAPVRQEPQPQIQYVAVPRAVTNEQMFNEIFDELKEQGAKIDLILEKLEKLK